MIKQPGYSFECYYRWIYGSHAIQDVYDALKEAKYIAQAVNMIAEFEKVK